MKYDTKTANFMHKFKIKRLVFFNAQHFPNTPFSERLENDPPENLDLRLFDACIKKQHIFPNGG